MPQAWWRLHHTHLQIDTYGVLQNFWTTAYLHFLSVLTSDVCRSALYAWWHTNMAPERQVPWAGTWVDDLGARKVSDPPSDPDESSRACNQDNSACPYSVGRRVIPPRLISGCPWTRKWRKTFRKTKSVTTVLCNMFYLQIFCRQMSHHTQETRIALRVVIKIYTHTAAGSSWKSFHWRYGLIKNKSVQTLIYSNKTSNFIEKICRQGTLRAVEKSSWSRTLRKLSTI